MNLMVTLESAMDFRRKKGDTTHTVRSRKVGNIWYVDKCGPTYANCWRVTDYDAEGLIWLEAHQCKGEDHDHR